MQRRTITLAALGAVATLGTSLAAGTAQTAGPGQSTIRIQPGELPGGADTKVLYSTGSTIHVGDQDIDTDLSGPLHVVGRSDHGFVVTTNRRLWNVHRDGSTTSLGTMPVSRENVEVSTDGSRVAYSWRRDGHVRVTVRRTSDGDRLHTATFGADATFVGYGKQRLLISTWSPDRTFWYAPSTEARDLLTRNLAWRVDVKADRVGFAVRDPHGYDGLCVRFSRLSTPHRSTWYSCKQKPLAWSARGGRVLTTDIRSDGLGPTAVQMRKVDGTRLRTFRTGVFGDVRFDGKNVALLSAQGANQAALVRCVLEGGTAQCTRVTRLRPASDLGPNTALRLSMPS